MTRFADSPYFLLKDFMLELVAPLAVAERSVEVTNLTPNMYFVDYVYVGGKIRDIPSSPYSSLGGDSNSEALFPINDGGVEFYNSSDALIQWNFTFDSSYPSNYFSTDYTDGKGIIMRGGETAIVLQREVSKEAHCSSVGDFEVPLGQAAHDPVVNDHPVEFFSFVRSKLRDGLAAPGPWRCAFRVREGQSREGNEHGE